MRLTLAAVIERHQVCAAVHFAAFKAVGESMQQAAGLLRQQPRRPVQPVPGSERQRAKALVFSSSATVYGKPERLPISEDSPLSTTNPYGATKLISEDVLRDLQRADADWRIALLRYFNPVGAHDSGRIGEDPRGIPNNLMPYITQVAVGKRARLQVFGNDYDTVDGTGVRDYIHVVDLAEGHVAALRRLLDQPGSLTVNLGTGTGYSVLEMVRAFERASGRASPLRHRRSPAGRHRRLLCRPDAGTSTARLAGAARPRHHVRGQLALAATQSGRLCRDLRAIDSTRDQIQPLRP